MKKMLATFLCLVPAIASAEGVSQSYNLGGATSNLQAIESNIQQAASTGALKPQQVVALNAKQHEIENLIQHLTAKRSVTSDEYAAVQLNLKQQQARLATYEHTTMPARRAADSTALPATYTAPNGTTVVAPYSNATSGAVLYSGSGAVTNPAPLNTLSRQ